MPIYEDGLSPKIRTMVQKINDVGVTDIVRYCDKYRPRINIRRQIKIVRHVAKLGYTYEANEFGITRHGAEISLKRMYEIALKVEEMKRGKDD